MGGHFRQGAGKHARQNLIHHFHHADLDAPHVGQGHGGFQTDEAAAHDDGLADLAFLTGRADGVGGLQTGERKHVAEVFALHRRHARAGARGQHQFVVGQFFFLAADHVFDQQGSGRAVNGQGAGLGAHGKALHGAEKCGVAQRVVGRGAQVVQILDFAGNIVGDAAAAVGDVDIFIHKGHFGIGHQTHAAGGGFGAQGHAAHNNNFFSHTALLIHL